VCLAGVLMAVGFLMRCLSEQRQLCSHGGCRVPLAGEHTGHTGASNKGMQQLCSSDDADVLSRHVRQTCWWLFSGSQLCCT
jgi:hypothetical protein